MREGFERVGLLAVILVPIIGAANAANDVPETALGVIGIDASTRHQ